MNKREVEIGAVYEHFKAETSNDHNAYRYMVLCTAKHTETKEQLVIYKALYPPYTICARPLEMFLSDVDKVKYPNIHRKYRMTKIFPVQEV